MPRRVALAGEPMRTVRPEIAIVPASGRTTPVSSLTRVDLPAPFAPSNAWISPGSTTSVAERSATTAP